MRLLAFLLLFAPAVHAQVILGRASSLDDTNADFHVPMGLSGSSATEVSRAVLTSPLGNIVRFCAYSTVDPANGVNVQSWTLELRLEGADVGGDVVLSEGSAGIASTVCVTDVVAISTAGQDLSIQITPANTPVATGHIRFAWVFLPTTPGQTWWGVSSGGTNLNDTTTQYLAPHVRGIPNNTEIQTALVIPTAGVVSAFYGEFSGAAGTGNSYFVDARLCTDANPPVCADQTVDFTVAGASEVADNSGADTFAVVAGEQVSVQINPDSTPTARHFRGGMTFTPTIFGEFVLGLVSEDPLNPLATEYAELHTGLAGDWNATESAVSSLAGFFTIKAVYARLSAAPDVGVGVQSFTLGPRDDVADVTDFQVTITDTDVSGSITTQDFQGVAPPSDMTWQAVPALAPTAATASLSILAFDPSGQILGGGE